MQAIQNINDIIDRPYVRSSTKQISNSIYYFPITKVAAMQKMLGIEGTIEQVCI